MDASPPQQLDIFDHSRDVMLRNDLAEALLQRNAAAAAAAVCELAAEYPHDDGLHDAKLLIEALGATGDPSPFHSAKPLLTASEHLEQRLTPAARRLLGDSPGRAPAWLATQWGRLAERARMLPFSPEHDAIHAAALCLRANQWQAAAQAVQTIESWRRIPAPLAWMAQARWHLLGLDAAWPLLAELAWLAPPRLEPLARTLPDPLLHKLMQGFDANFEPADDGPAAADAYTWFPAWALIEQPALAGPLSLTQPSRQTAPERALQLILTLLRLERQGRHPELIAQRRQLQGLHQGLFATYMKTR